MSDPNFRRRLQIMRGEKEDIPTLKTGEFGLAVDTEELFIGVNGVNKQLATSAINAVGVTTFTVQIPTSGWTLGDDDLYSKVISVPNLHEPSTTSMTFMNPVYTTTNYTTVMNEYSKIIDANATENYLTLKVSDLLTTSISVVIKEVR